MASQLTSSRQGRRWSLVASLAAIYVVVCVVVAVLAAQFAQSPGGHATGPLPDAAAPSMATTTTTSATRPATTTTTTAGAPIIAAHPPRAVVAATSEPTTRRTRSSGTTTRSSSLSLAPTVAAPTVEVAAATVNLAAGRPVSVADYVHSYAGSNVTDGDTSTYWESEASFPQTLRVDLGTVTTVSRLILALPPISGWGSRTQTVQILGSKDGASYSSLVGATGYTFDANATSKNAVTVILPRSTQRWVELRFLANNGWPSAQLSELRVYSS